ncbi:ATP synthase subunit b [Philodulcilactobacillus myokoensis]|uniref:ATP synthase subunit b n=1 Tax=Philodulcilactobacillus myokoensis TaxID=2929573 RepID=A0A9W6B1C0_9LACO|nr:F0F1 ATP synthase subunit B [Philodulcilactobacillus myokoensis]GLB47080.1 ATP synthase subunit b [Philodulcilactobacillus myokoensis]
MLSHLFLSSLSHSLVSGTSNGLYIGDAVYIAVLFIILMWLVKLVAWKPLNEMLKKRSDKITNDMDSAEKLHKEADDLASQRRDALSRSHADATKIVNDAKSAGQQQRTDIINAANEDSKNLKASAKKDIAQERQDALSNAKNDVADLSIEIASKIIQKELKADDQKKLINSYIEGLGKQNDR